MACWHAGRHPRWGPGAISSGGGILKDLPEGVFSRMTEEGGIFKRGMRW
jgi:hypothetical protein